MDVPRVAAVEMPLAVRNTGRAIAMLGGKDRILRSLSDSDPRAPLAGPTNSGLAVGATGAPGSGIPLELRLRDDPFHHPVQSLVTNQERILLKVSVPKRIVAKLGPGASVRDAVMECAAAGADYKVQPVAIINKTFSFKRMADFQAITKHNAVAQEYQRLIGANSLQPISDVLSQREGFQGIEDYKNPSGFANDDHGLPPPPVFSPISFPFDYKYNRNPLTTTVTDSEGTVRVVSRKATLKLYTIIVDYSVGEIPPEPAEALRKNLQVLTATPPQPGSTEAALLSCLDWLRRAFDVKPIWLRKHLEDVAPADLRRVLKQALPYVSYIFKSGPWRFCNVKFGVDPKSDQRYWVYQSEYFRIPGIHFGGFEVGERVLPATIIGLNAGENARDFAVSQHLLFTGTRLPHTVTYQIGDVSDPDVDQFLQPNDLSFFRSSPDFQDGWINRQSVETVRRIIRYKLSRMVKEEPIEASKIEKIIATEYVEREESDHEASDIESEIESMDDADVDDLRDRIAQLDSTHPIRKLAGYVNQDDL